MTKKDYIIIAKCVDQALTDIISHQMEFAGIDARQENIAINTLTHLVGVMTDKFVEDNPRFDFKKFEQACGLVR